MKEVKDLANSYKRKPPTIPETIADCLNSHIENLLSKAQQFSTQFFTRLTSRQKKRPEFGTKHQKLIPNLLLGMKEGQRIFYSPFAVFTRMKGCQIGLAGGHTPYWNLLTMKKREADAPQIIGTWQVQVKGKILFICFSSKKVQNWLPMESSFWNV